MKNIVFITKTGKELETEEVLEVFNSVNDLDKIKKAVEHAKDRIYVSWATVDMKDNEGQVIPIDDIIKEQKNLMERNGPITDSHTNRIIGETMAYKVLQHPESKTTGILHLDKIFSHNDLDAQVWDEIQTGKRKGSSVGGYNDSVSTTFDKVTGTVAEKVEGFKQLETASVDNPCNPLALNEAFSLVAKGDKKTIKEDIKKPFGEYNDFVDCVKQNQDKKNPQAFCAWLEHKITGKWPTEKELESNDSIKKIKGDNMTEKEIKKQEEETTEGPSLESIAQALQALADRLDALEASVGTSKEDDEEKPTEEEKKPEVEKEGEGEVAVAPKSVTSDTELQEGKAGDTETDAPSVKLIEKINDLTKDISEIKKSLNTSSTPRLPVNKNKPMSEVKKELIPDALSIATGKTKITNAELAYMENDFRKAAMAEVIGG